VNRETANGKRENQRPVPPNFKPGTSNSFPIHLFPAVVSRQSAIVNRETANGKRETSDSTPNFKPGTSNSFSIRLFRQS